MMVDGNTECSGAEVAHGLVCFAACGYSGGLSPRGEYTPTRLLAAKGPCVSSAPQALQTATSSVARAVWRGSGVIADGKTEWSGHVVPTSVPSISPWGTPICGSFVSFHLSWMAGGAARQPLWTASASSARPWQHVTAPSIHLGGNSEQATCRPPSRGPPPRRDARASDLLDFDTASGLHACTEFSHAGTQFSQHGTTMMFQEPSCGSRLSHS